MNMMNENLNLAQKEKAKKILKHLELMWNATVVNKDPGLNLIEEIILKIIIRILSIGNIR